MRTELVCMRLSEMKMVHPMMTRDKTCCRCGETVGMYPSGQRILEAGGDLIEIVCNHCYFKKADLFLAPSEVLDEVRESVRREEEPEQ